jgi:hypothetical protein
MNELAPALGDRLAYAEFGALTGAACGCLIALGVYLVTEVGQPFGLPLVLPSFNPLPCSEEAPMPELRPGCECCQKAGA